MDRDATVDYSGGDSEPSTAPEPATRSSRAASMNRELLASVPNESHVSSSLDHAKCCRICLEHSDHVEPFHAGRLIAPCQCRGSSGWVHRGCLDRWRATQEERAFSQCTECTFPYVYVQKDEGDERGWLFKDGPLTGKRRRKLRFQLFVARDFLFVFLVFQICVFLIAGAVRKLDCGKWKDCVGFDVFGNESVYQHYFKDDTHYTDDATVCCPSGFIVNEIPPFTLMKNHTRSAYYLAGLILFFSMVGVAGCLSKRVCPAWCCDCCNLSDCGSWYWWYSPSPPVHQGSCSRNCQLCIDGCDEGDLDKCLEGCSCCDDCCRCCCWGESSSNRRSISRQTRAVNYSVSSDGDCSGCCDDCDCKIGGGGGGGEAGIVLLALIVVVIVIFAVIGVMEGLFFLSMVMQRSMQRHFHMLQKAALAEEFVVEDLCGNNGCRSVNEVLEARAQAVEAIPSAPPAITIGNPDMLRDSDAGEKARLWVDADSNSNATGATTASELPKGWESRNHPSGNVQYVNTNTGEKSWTKPGAATDCIARQTTAEGRGLFEEHMARAELKAMRLL